MNSLQGGMRLVALTVNGQPVIERIPASMSLAELLRDRLRLTGTKIACDQAACSACTVLLDGAAIFACHTLAAQATGGSILTIEGLSRDGALDPLQRGFIEHDALQCGFCTPGMIMAVKATVDSGSPPDRAALAYAISGNICRCGTYEQILDAALDAAKRQR
jgi:aerobic-type carbon monoxide dehydrogenase small subunit (CoxS/CutS family)